MECSKCKTINDEGSVFCRQCGERLDIAQTSGNSAQTSPSAYCPKCGKPIYEGQRFCASCGYFLGNSDQPLSNNTAAYSSPDPSSEKVGPLGILFFCIPIVGAVMYFVWRDEYPKKSEKACHLALWGVGVAVILRILANL